MESNESDQPEKSPQDAVAQLNIKYPKVKYAFPPHPRQLTEEESNQFRSSSTLIRRLAESVAEWRKTLPKNIQPVIMAVLQGGMTIKVVTLAEEGHHGIRIHGFINDQPTMILSHQSSVQLMCIAEEVEDEDAVRKIGFIMDGEQIDA